MSHHIFQQIVDGSLDAIAAFDTNLEFIYGNLPFCKEFRRNYGVPIVPGDSLKVVFSAMPSQLQLAERIFARVFTGEKFTLRLEVGLPEFHRGLYEMAFFPLYDDQGKLVGAAMDSRDISDSAHWKDWALDCAKAGTCTWNLLSGTLEWDAHLYELLGVDPDKARPTYGAWLNAVVAEDRPRLHAAVREVLAGRQRHFQLDFRIRHPEGLRWLTFFGRTDYGADLRPSRIAGLCIDLTDLRETELALAAARDEAIRAQAEAERAARAKSRFLAAVSHDLRQPAQALTLLVSLLKQRAAGTALAGLDVSIERAVSALKLVLDGVLDISRLDAGIIDVHPEMVSVGDMLRRLAGAYRQRAEDQRLDLRLVPSSATAWTDPLLLERMISQLLENALRFTPHGRILVGCRRRGERLSIEVLDTGIGIADDQRESIFQEFYQVGNEARDRALGLGLGLAVVRRLAEILGAEVRVFSVPGRGSRFAIVLPAEVPCGGNLAEQAPPFLGPPLGCVAMVVEDDETVRTSLRLLLERWGYGVIALATAEAAADCGVVPDFILADLQLNGGMNGMQAIEAIRRRCGKPVPAVIVTGDTEPARTLELQRLGFPVLYKPVGVDDLQAQLARMLGDG